MMKVHADNLEFEKAIELRDRIEILRRQHTSSESDATIHSAGSLLVHACLCLLHACGLCLLGLGGFTSICTKVDGYKSTPTQSDGFALPMLTLKHACMCIMKGSKKHNCTPLEHNSIMSSD